MMKKSGTKKRVVEDNRDLLVELEATRLTPRGLRVRFRYADGLEAWAYITQDACREFQRSVALVQHQKVGK
jgi:hypothetical protein